MNSLVLDIGNTHTVAGIFAEIKNSKDIYRSQALQIVRFRTDKNATADEYSLLLRQIFKTDFLLQTKRAIISSVVPHLDSSVREALKELNPLFITFDKKSEFELKLPFPNQLGADRLANIAGALLIKNGPFVIIDAGTATTFCLVDEKNRYLGGAITPGFEISWEALKLKASKLFSVELKHPKLSIGNTTESQIQSGVILGYEALIEGMTDRIVSDAIEQGFITNKSAVTYFATGGCTGFLKLSSRFQIEPNLTLYGLLQYGILNS